MAVAEDGLLLDQASVWSLGLMDDGLKPVITVDGEPVELVCQCLTGEGGFAEYYAQPETIGADGNLVTEIKKGFFELSLWRGNTWQLNY